MPISLSGPYNLVRALTQKGVNMRIFSIHRKGFRNLVANADLETLVAMKRVLEVCIHGEKFDDQTRLDSHMESLSLVVTGIELFKTSGMKIKAPNLKKIYENESLKGRLYYLRR